MGESEGRNKIYRILNLYERFNKGELINKKSEAEKYNVDARTIQRDIDELRIFFSEDINNQKDIIYDRKKKAYRISNKEGFKFHDKDVFVLSKILLESRAFSKKEMDRMLDILICSCNDESNINKMISNERFNYVPPKHNKNIIDFIWEINRSIKLHKEAKVKYKRQDGKIREYNLRPLGLLFNEYYFYVLGEIVGKHSNNSIVFRVDRFEKYEITEKDFLPYENRLKEGEFNKRIQFMYTGDLITIQFKFWGDSLEAILDRLPTSRVIKEYEEDNIKISLIEAEVYGEGIKRWLLSQKEYLEVLRPESYRNDIKETIRKMYELYK